MKSGKLIDPKKMESLFDTILAENMRKFEETANSETKQWDKIEKLMIERKRLK